MPKGIWKKEKKSVEIRFLEKITKTDDCWIWIGCRNNYNYGSFAALGETLAHRFSYKFYKGNIPKNMLVCHTCDNPPCVNPNHLWVGNAKDNSDDCFRKKRDRRVTVRGEDNGISKLDNDKIKEIRKMYEEGFFQYEIAKKFNVHQTNIHYILNGKTWRHV